MNEQEVVKSIERENSFRDRIKISNRVAVILMFSFFFLGIWMGATLQNVVEDKSFLDYYAAASLLIGVILMAVGMRLGKRQ